MGFIRILEFQRITIEKVTLSTVKIYVRILQKKKKKELIEQEITAPS
jgi:hypothetical protein